uniref:Uncharacterized protein n=1 Tax=Arundo donax TaxID=35708 RepID=A0A0A8ZQR6_ARUDO
MINMSVIFVNYYN